MTLLSATSFILVRRFSRVFLLIFGGWLVAACVDHSTPPLRVGTNVWPGYEPLYLARTLGYFDESNVELVEYLSASEVIRAFRNGSLEAAALTLDEALLLHDHGISMAIVLVTDFSEGGDVVLAKPGIDSVEELVGKRVGVEGNALGAYMLSRALDIHHTPIDSITLIQLEVSEHADAYLQDKVDAVVTFEPVRSKLLSAGAREIFSSRNIPGEIVDVIVVHTDYLAKHPDTVVGMSQAWFMAVEYLRQQPDDAAEKMSERLGLTPKDVLASYDGLMLPTLADNKKLLDGDLPELLTTINRLQQVLLANQLISNKLAVEGLIQPSTLP